MTGEICKVTTSRGHHYLELADHGESLTPRGAGAGRGAATLEVACWARDWPVVQYELAAVGLELVPGLVVRVRGKVTVWEGGSKLRFSMTALDVEALVGGIAAARRRLLGSLAAEGIIDGNRRLPLPAVPLRIGLVTSAGLGGLPGLHRSAGAVGLLVRRPFRAVDRPGTRGAGTNRRAP